MIHYSTNSSLKIIQTMPNEESFEHFKNVPYQVYSREELESFQLHQLENKFLKVCLVVLEKEIPKARVGIYFNPDLHSDGKVAATLGAYESVDKKKYWKLILMESVKICKENGAFSIIGPMSGSTWYDYRFMDNLNAHEDVFFGETYNSKAYPNHFRAFGFKRAASFYSFIDKNPEFRGIAVKESKLRFENNGVKIRSINLDSYLDELKKIHKFSNEVFSSNFLFSPITQKQFLDKFIPLQSVMDPRFVFLAEHNNELVGVVLCFHDYYSKNRKRLVIKTLARKKDYQYSGIGKILGHMAIKNAREQGYEDIIHALMHGDNFSINLSKNSMGEEFKNYSLFKIDIDK